MKFTTLFTSLILILLASTSCNPKLALAAQSDDVILNTAFTQTEVPGQENSKPIDYLKVKLDLNENVTDFKANTIIFRGKEYTAQYHPRMMKVNLAEGLVTKNDTKLKDNQALLTYTIGGVEQTLVINNIEAKEALYLP